MDGQSNVSSAHFLGGVFCSLGLPLALRLQIQGHRGLLHPTTGYLRAPLRMTLGLGARRNNRLFPLGGSSVHAHLPAGIPSSWEDSSPAQALHRPLPTGRIKCCKKKYCQGMAGIGVVRGSPLAYLSRQVIWSCTELSQAPLSGWVPPRAIPFPLPSP